MLISTRPGASNSDVQSVVGSLATAASSGQLLYDLKAVGECTCLLIAPCAPSTELDCSVLTAHDVEGTLMMSAISVMARSS